MATLKAYIYAAFFAALAFAGVFLYREGRKAEQNKVSSDNLDAMRKARDIRDEVENDPYLIDRASQWVRKEDS